MDRVVDKDMNNLHIKPGDAVHHGKMRKMIIIIMLFIWPKFAHSSK